MTDVPVPTTPPAPAPTPAPGGGGNPPPTAPPTARQQHDPDDEGDGDALDLTPAQQSAARRRRLERSRDEWRSRATTAETEAAAVRAERDALRAQVGSVAQLRSSLLSSAIRAQAATMIIPEAIDDAVRLLETTDLQVSDDGKVDETKIKAKLDDFVKIRPHLVPRAGSAPSALPGGHRPPPAGTGNADINQMLREAAGRG